MNDLGAHEQLGFSMGEVEGETVGFIVVGFIVEEDEGERVGIFVGDILGSTVGSLDGSVL